MDEKAFDRVEWDYLFDILGRFVFRSMLISWIKLLYTSPSAMVLMNNLYSKPFDLPRGTRLALAVRCNHSILGIKRGNTISGYKLNLHKSE